MLRMKYVSKYPEDVIILTISNGKGYTLMQVPMLYWYHFPDGLNKLCINKHESHVMVIS